MHRFKPDAAVKTDAIGIGSMNRLMNLFMHRNRQMNRDPASFYLCHMSTTASTKPERIRQVDGPPGGVLPLELELLGPPLLDRRPPEYRVQVQRNHKQVAHVGELPLGRLGRVRWVEIQIVSQSCQIDYFDSLPHLEHGQRSPHAEADRPVRVVERGGLDGAGLPRLQRRLPRHLEGYDVAAPVERKSMCL